MPETVAQKCSVNKVFLQENTGNTGTPVPESLLNKVAGLTLQLY